MRTYIVHRIAQLCGYKLIASGLMCMGSEITNDALNISPTMHISRRIYSRKKLYLLCDFICQFVHRFLVHVFFCNAGEVKGDFFE